MIHNIVFDYGGVIVNIYESQIRTALRDLGISRWKQFIHYRHIRSLMSQFIDGLVPSDQIVEQILPYCRRGTTSSNVYQAVEFLCGELPISRLQQLQRLRSRYRVIMLSNINDMLWRRSCDYIERLGYQVADLFDECYCSYQMQLAKPDPRIFQQFITQTGVLPSETLYFDDRADNVRSGRNAGFQAVLVPSNHLEGVKEYQEILKSMDSVRPEGEKL